MSLWKLEREYKDSEDNKNNPLYGASQLLQSNDSNNGLINILDEYTWTISKEEGRLDSPYIYLIEKKVTQDTIIQQAIYNLKAVYESGEVGAQSISTLLQNITDLDDDTEILKKIKKDSAKDSIKNKQTSQKEKDTLFNPYKGLYALDDTGWQYIFPYFNMVNRDLSQSWGDIDAKGVSGNAANLLSNMVEGGITDVNRLTAALGGVSSGNLESPIITYIEKPKQYSYGGNTPSYSFSFYLFNTHKYEDIVKNWELCYLLLYQNLPNRKTKSIIDPPALYEVIIPGIKHSPLSYISSLRIDFVGVTRLMDVEVGLDKKSIKSIIPDAYKVTITINDLFPESKNFLEGVLESEKRITISNGDSSVGISRDLNSFSISDDESGGLFDNIRKSANRAVNNAVQSAGNIVKNAVSGIFGGGG